MKDTALKYHSYGLNAIPCKMPNKLPFVGSKNDADPEYHKWKTFQTRMFDRFEIFDYTGAIGLICGEISGNLEVIDVDSKYDLTGTLFEELQTVIRDNIGDDFWQKLVVETTTSGGYHLFFRCEEIEGNQKLAERPDNGKNVCLIETRGEGGFVVVAPSKGYTLIQGDFSQVPTITADERAILMDCCRSFNQVAVDDFASENVVRFSQVATNSEQPKATGKKPPFEVTPWEDFNNRNDIVSVLESYGWAVRKGGNASGNEVHMIYPGKKNLDETAAVANRSRNNLVVYSSNSPLPTEHEGRKAHTPFSVFCFYECNSDKDKAIELLEEKGYGRRKPKYTTSKSSRKEGVVKEITTHHTNADSIKKKDFFVIVESESEKGLLAEYGVENCVLSSEIAEFADALASYSKQAILISYQEVDVFDRDSVFRTVLASCSLRGVDLYLLSVKGSLAEFIKSLLEEKFNYETGDNERKSLEENLKILSKLWLKVFVQTSIITDADKLRLADLVAKVAVNYPYNAHPILLEHIKGTEYKYIRDTFKAEVGLKKKKEKEKELSNADITGVSFDEDGTHVLNQYNHMVLVCDWKISIPYQLPTDELNECEWIVELSKGENFMYLRIPNNKIGALISMRNIFRNAKVKLNVDAKQLDTLLNNLIPSSKQAKSLDVLGWNPEARLWMFADRAFCVDSKKWYIPNEVSMIEKDGEVYYMPYVDAMNKPNPDALAYTYRPSSISFSSVAKFVRKSWGDENFIFFIREVAAWFMDFVSTSANPSEPFFPIGFILGMAGSGKSTFTGIFKYFYTRKTHKVMLRMGNTEAGIISAMTFAQNITIPFDDYGHADSKMDVGETSAMLVAMWNFGLGLKRSISDFGKLARDKVLAMPTVNANRPPVDDTFALQTRLIFSRMDKTEFTVDESEKFMANLTKISEDGLNDALLEIIQHRKTVETFFADTYKAQQRFLKESLSSYKIESRTIDGYAMVTAVARVLIERCGISFGGLKVEAMNEIARDGLIRQYNALVQKQPLQIFWEYVQYAYENKTLISGHHFDIDLNGFRTRAGYDLMSGAVLFIRFNSLYQAYSRVCYQMGKKPEAEAYLKTLLRESKFYESKLNIDGKSEISEVKSRKFYKLQADLDNNPEAPRDFTTTGIALYYDKLQDEYDIDLQKSIG